MALRYYPEEARRELLDFYEYLLNKCGRAEKEEVAMEKRKLQFFESVKRHSFVLPERWPGN